MTKSSRQFHAIEHLQSIVTTKFDDAEMPVQFYVLCNLIAN